MPQMVMLFEKLVKITLGVIKEEMSQPVFAGLGCLTYPELHNVRKVGNVVVGGRGSGGSDRLVALVLIVVLLLLLFSAAAAAAAGCTVG